MVREKRVEVDTTAMECNWTSRRQTAVGGLRLVQASWAGQLFLAAMIALAGTSCGNRVTSQGDRPSQTEAHLEPDAKGGKVVPKGGLADSRGLSNETTDQTTVILGDKVANLDKRDDLRDSHIWPFEVGRTERPLTASPLPGQYGEIGTRPQNDFVPSAADSSHLREWQKREFAYVSTELSPAVLYQNRHNQITFFHNIQSWGLGAPRHFAIQTSAGTRVYQYGDRVAGSGMREAWLLTWFAGAKGWLFDVPWLIVLQRRPESIALGEQGLTITFANQCGRVVAMPLYGYYKCPPAGRSWAKEFPGATDFGIDTSSWKSYFPSAVADRCRWWARVHRRFPVYLRETFSVDRLRETVTVRSKVDFIDIVDDWGTVPLTFAPLAPTLALALTDDQNSFPVSVSEAVTDPFIFTPHGPYMGVVGKDSYDLTFSTLKYINEVEIPPLPPWEAPPLSHEALARLRATAARRWSTDQQMPIDHGRHNYVWAAAGDRWYPRAIPYIKDLRVRENAKRSLRSYMANWVLDDNTYQPYQGNKKPYKGIYLLHGPGIGSWGELGDAGKFAENQFPLIWSYAHFTGDRELLKERWSLVKKLDITPLESNWKGFGRGGIAEMGDEAAPPLQFARSAYLVGDVDTYHYQCYISTRELVHLFVKQRGAQYFRKMQPYHQYFLERVPRNYIEPIPETVYCSNLFGGLHGWQIDGPGYPAKHREYQYRNRWIRFSSLEVARFFRDHIKGADLREEFRELEEHFHNEKNRAEVGRSSPLTWDDAHLMPSLVRLYSLALSPPPSFEDIDRLAAVRGEGVKFGRWRLYPDSSVIASSISVLRLASPPHYDRIIPRSGTASAFVLGLERSVRHGWGILLQDIQVRRPNEGGYDWPVISWPNWRAPRGDRELPAGDQLTFGMVTPTPGRRPREAGGYRSLNWNSYSNWLR